MKRFVISVAMFAGLVFIPALTGCSSECDKLCKEFAKCVSAEGEKSDGVLETVCMKECKKDPKKFKESLETMCNE